MITMILLTYPPAIVTSEYGYDTRSLLVEPRSSLTDLLDNHIYSLFD